MAKRKYTHVKELLPAIQAMVERAMGDEFSSMPLDEKNDKWVLEDAGDGLVYIKNVAHGLYVEWYADKSNWSGYGTIGSGKEGMFAIKLVKV